MRGMKIQDLTLPARRLRLDYLNHLWTCEETSRVKVIVADKSMKLPEYQFGEYGLK